jgi:hypothetical protein
MKKTVLILWAFFLPLLSAAQDDSVWVEGIVTDAVTEKPESVCEVQLFQENEVKAIAFCDEEGRYTIGWMPPGTYSMSVISKGTTLYCAELSIMEDAILNIALVHDSLLTRTLAPVVVAEKKHGLGERLITSPDDYRLWNFNGTDVLWDIGPASSSCCNSKCESDYFSNPGKLCGWRPRWLDAPFTKQVKHKKEGKKKETDEKTE